MSIAQQEKTIVGAWIEAESRDERNSPSYYAADWEILRTKAGRYPVSVTTSGFYQWRKLSDQEIKAGRARGSDWSLRSPYWLHIAIDADRIDGKLYSGFGGLNFASTDLPREAKPLRLQLYAYALPSLVAQGLIEVDPAYVDPLLTAYDLCECGDHRSMHFDQESAQSGIVREREASEIGRFCLATHGEWETPYAEREPCSCSGFRLLIEAVAFERSKLDAPVLYDVNGKRYHFDGFNYRDTLSRTLPAPGSALADTQERAREIENATIAALAERLNKREPGSESVFEMHRAGAYQDRITADPEADRADLLEWLSRSERNVKAWHLIPAEPEERSE